MVRHSESGVAAVNSKALAQGDDSTEATLLNVAATPALASTRRPEAATRTATPPAANGSLPIHVLIGRFFHSLHVLVSAVRLYQRNHPRVTESLESAERDLRAVFRQWPMLSVSVTRASLAAIARDPQHEHQTLADPRGELRSLAEELADAGVNSLTFLPQTNLGELALLAHAVDATSRSTSQQRGGRAAAPRNWSAWLVGQKVAGILVNAPIERREDTLLAILLGALPSAERTAAGPPETFSQCTLEQARSALRFLATAAPRLKQAQRQSPQEAAGLVRAELAGADSQTLALVTRSVVLDPPRHSDTVEPYLGRVGDALAVNFVRQEYLAGRARAVEVRSLLDHLNRHGGPAGEEAQGEARVERFWSSLPAREKARALASRDAWCMPVPVLRRYLEPLIAAAARRGAEASGREARRALADFVRCVESEEEKARRSVAAGLVELTDLIEQLWPHPRFADLSRKVVGALVRETSPGIAGLLAAATEILARLALERGQYADFERILDGLAQAPRDAEHEHIAALWRRILAQERWLLLVDTALANRSLDPALPRLLRRDPERLLDRLSLLLTAPEGANALPAMARLVRAAGEPVLGALQAHLSEPRRQRVATAIKLLSAVQPERLTAALPHALPAWDWSLQDLAVIELMRQPSSALRAQVASEFLATLNEAHLLVVPSMLDHIARTEGPEAVPRLIEIAAGGVDRLRDVFIRIKAIEALGHMRAESAAPLLRELVRSRSGLTYVEPAGLRSTAEEALALIENRPSSARLRATKETIEKSNARFAHPRRYVRVTLPSPMPARIEGPHAAKAQVRTISLGGATLETKSRLAVRDSIHVEIRAGLRRIRSTAIVRTATPAGYGIEFVHMKHEDREKLRRRLIKLLP